MTVFSAAFSAVAISVAQDLFEIVAPSDSRVRLLEIDIGQYSDIGGATADLAAAEQEIISLTIHRGHTVSGSGGSTVTPVNVNPYSRAAGATLATLDAAFALCTADKGYRIIILPNHSETVTGVGGITADVAGVSVIGLGIGAQRPRFLMDGAATVTQINP